MMYWELQCVLGAIALVGSGVKKLREKRLMRHLRMALSELQDAHIAFAFGNDASEAAIEKAVARARQVHDYSQRKVDRMHAKASGFARSDADQERREQLIYSAERIERLLDLLERAIHQLDPSFT